MSRPATFLAVDDVVAIHGRMIQQFGGEPGLRDRGLLESAVAMPAARVGGRYLHRGNAAKAATYLFHLCGNHAFLDGNKRTALAAADVFLRLNGASLSATDDELEELTVGVATGAVSKHQVVRFFRAHVRS